MPSRFRSFDRDPVIARTQVRLQKRVMPGAVVRRRGEAGQKCRSQAQRGFQQAEGFDPVEPAFGNRQLEATLFVAFEIEMMGFARRECRAGRRGCNRRQRRRLLLPGIVPGHYDGPVFLSRPDFHGEGPVRIALFLPAHRGFDTRAIGAGNRDRSAKRNAHWNFKRRGFPLLLVSLRLAGLRCGCAGLAGLFVGATALRAI